MTRTTPPARTLMVQGTASSVGKSIITAALCRIFMQDGLRVAPFKAQNMSNNSYVTADGGEMGRAQVVQAAAAGVEPTVDMNPILLKPEADSRSQVVLNGRLIGSFSALDYYGDRERAWSAVTASLARLRAEYDVVVIEGAGSPAEVNLRSHDIVNMRVALHAGSPVLLVGDIDRGGVFASLLGTLELLAPEERALVRGLVINRFRGDRALLEPLPSMIAERTGVPMVGVVPFLHDLQIKEEDGATLGDRDSASGCRPAGHHSTGSGWRSSEAVLRAAVMALPRISNLDDADPLRRAGVQVDHVTSPRQVHGAHLILIPGTKNTIADLRWMKSRGLDQAIAEAAANGAAVIGICGGYQILCERLDDPHGADSGAPDSESGLGLLPGVTTFAREKVTQRVSYVARPGQGMLAGDGEVSGMGYEIHTGHTASEGQPALEVRRAVGHVCWDGAVSADGWTMGTYVHGLFDSRALLSRILGNIAQRHGNLPPVVPDFSMEAEFDRLADAVRGSLDMDYIYGLLGRPSNATLRQAQGGTVAAR